VSRSEIDDNAPSVAQPIAQPAAQPIAPPIALHANDRDWYRDPLALTLVTTGVAGLGGAGILFMRAAGSEDAAKQATDYPSFLQRAEEADRRRVVGWIALGAGGTLLGLGLWRAIHVSSEPGAQIGLSITPSGAAIAGTF
jgi:hypothetical protein